MLDGRRIVFSRPGVVELEPHAVDESDLGPSEVVLRTRTTVISPGTELAWLWGKTLRYGDEGDGDGSFRPRGVGYANVATVVAAGAEAPVAVGDRVYTMTPHTSVARIDTAQALCVPVPDVVPDDEAPFVRLATVSMTTLVTSPARPGDEVTVVGLGLVGNLAAQVFDICGYRTSGIDLSPARREHARRCGLASVYDPEGVGHLRRGQRLVVEATGSAKALAGAVELAKDGGEVVMVGAPWGGADNSVPSGMLTGEIFLRFLRLRSGSEWELPVQPAQLAAGSIRQNTVAALDWMAGGHLQAAPLITHRLPPEAAAEAYDGLRTRPDEHLGVVLQWPTQE